ncbi:MULTISPECIES: DUF3311 domain-containing protein [unclassified Novosphingobium]|uniref:DUF3311 domain-containing protein n=1 Tax=Novosphingobium TaxID=165696 RepID=UPI00144613F1|nr:MULTISPECIES: DUF3311 domain-containing protein [unclassified Novosphingobium]NKJ42415.1 hypothetical protein [Novosphingobium sp. SG720]NMN04800.1 hypothetical protein [Novosphingobium sp. SG919]NMN85206.1 hypothetical protein [Novosphingobium sp. SG916]
MTDSVDNPNADGGLRKADCLLLLPFVWQLGLAPWANGVSLRPLGLPFGMAWQMAGIVFATLVLALRYRIDRKGGARA